MRVMVSAMQIQVLPPPAGMPRSALGYHDTDGGRLSLLNLNEHEE